MPKPAFDPNKPFKAVEDVAAPVAAAQTKPAFDPNKPFKQVNDDSSLMDAPLLGGTPRGFIQGGLNALPTAGMLAGGAIGTAGGPVGAVGGAGLGAMGGKALKSLGERYLLDKPESRSDYYSGLAGAGMEGMSNEMGGRALGAGAKLAAETKVGQAVIKGTGKTASYLASSFSGVPQKEIEVYAKNADEINKLAKSNDYNSQEMADQLREKFNKDILSKKTELNAQISKALGSKGDVIELNPIVGALEEAKGQINSKLRPEEISEVDGIIKRIQSLGENGKIDLKNAHDAKEYLQEIAKGSYHKDGQIFTVGDKASKAAKAGAAMARKLVNKAAPEVAAANDSLSSLHDIEDVMNKNLLAEGKTGASLYAAGSGNNEASEKVLKQLGNITGTDMVNDAQKLSAARTFGKAPLLPTDTTGKTATRMGVVGGLGYLGGGPLGVIAAEGLASPLAIKTGINAGRGAAPIVANPQMGGLVLKEYLKKKGLMRGLVDERQD